MANWVREHDGPAGEGEGRVSFILWLRATPRVFNNQNQISGKGTQSRKAAKETKPGKEDLEIKNNITNIGNVPAPGSR